MSRPWSILKISWTPFQSWPMFANLENIYGKRKLATIEKATHAKFQSLEVPHAQHSSQKCMKCLLFIVMVAKMFGAPGNSWTRWQTFLWLSGLKHNRGFCSLGGDSWQTAKSDGASGCTHPLCISQNFSAFLYITLHFSAFLFISLHFLHFLAFLYISLHFSWLLDIIKWVIFIY